MRDGTTPVEAWTAAGANLVRDDAVLERIRSLPVQSGGVVRSSDLARAMGDG